MSRPLWCRPPTTRTNTTNRSSLDGLGRSTDTHLAKPCNMGRLDASCYIYKHAATYATHRRSVILVKNMSSPHNCL